MTHTDEDTDRHDRIYIYYCHSFSSPQTGRGMKIDRLPNTRRATEAKREMKIHAGNKRLMEKYEDQFPQQWLTD